MIQDSLLQSNYLGRDGFKWWIGQVADPTTSGWGSAKDKNDAVQSSTSDKKMYLRRCKVRILGYHTISDSDGYVLKDSDLPWAHIMVPSGQGTGVGGVGETHEYRGGENVLGFFLDGDDAQQPVIIGGFGRGPQTEDSEKGEKKSETRNEKDCIIKPFQPTQTYPQGMIALHLQKSPTDQTEPASTGNNDTGVPSTNPLTGQDQINYQGNDSSEQSYVPSGEADTASSNPASGKLEQGIMVERPATQTDSQVIGGIQCTLEAMLKTLKAVQEYKNLYLDQSIQAINNIGNQIGSYVKTISGYVRKLLEIVKAYIAKTIGDALNEAQRFLAETFKPIVSGSIAKAVEAIMCTIDRIIGTGIFDAVMGSVQTNIFGKVVDSLLCAVEQFVADILNTFLEPIFEQISGIFGQITKILGGISSQIGSSISQAMSILNRVIGIFSCFEFTGVQGACWSLSGPSKEATVSFQNILNKINIPDIPLPPGLEDKPRQNFSCDSNIGYLFPPIIDISFGDAILRPVVIDGKVVGIYIEEPGRGYSPLTPPAISIKQPGVWGTGGGARANALIGDDGGIERVEVTNPGSGYVNQPEVVATAIDGIDDPTLLPLPKVTDEKDLLPYLEKICILNPGVGYKNNDQILINDKNIEEYDIEATIEIGPAGSIFEINISNQNNFPVVFTEYPTITINSDTGVNASLYPCLGFLEVETLENESVVTVDGETIAVDQNDIQTIVNCIKK